MARWLGMVVAFGCFMGCPADEGSTPEGGDGAVAVADGEAPAGEDVADGASSVDEDGDGWSPPGDCDDLDPSLNPGAEESCDGIDNDCDGETDEGVPSDGAGCQEPEAPAAPEVIDVLHVSVRTGVATNDESDNGVLFCLNETDCFDLDNGGWDDYEAGNVDVHVFEGIGIARSDVNRVELRSKVGTDRWVPVCIQVTFDGEPVHCEAIEGLMMGDSAAEGEVMAWSSEAPLAQSCVTCFAAPLTHGPFTGASEPDGGRIWMRTDGTRRVALRVAAEETALTDVAPVAVRYPAASRDFTEVVQLRGLSPGETVFYDVEVEGARYGPYTLRASPPDGPVAARVAFGSCTIYDTQPAFLTIEALEPDVFLFIGDNHYGNTSDLGGLRQNYRWAHERPGRIDVMRQARVIATWDDHDFVGNNTTGASAGGDVAARVFAEYWANPSYGTEGLPGVFTRWRYGDVDFILVDDRYWRGLDGTLLGAGQTDWLVDALATSTATFKLVACGSQWTPYGSSDSWAAFPDAHGAFLESLVAAQVEGVVLLSGDIHRSEFRLLSSATGGYDLPELTSSPLANSTSTCVDEPDLLACYDDDASFIYFDVDTTVADPTLHAVLMGEWGAVVSEWTIYRSELTLR